MKRPLRIAHVIDTLDVGGAENGVVNLISGLRDRFDHAVVCVSRSGRLAERLPAGTAVRVVGKRPARDFRAVLRLARILRELRPDVVHSRNWGAFDAVLAGPLARVPVVVHGEHGREARDPGGLDRRRNRLRRLLGPCVHRWVTVSSDLGRWLTCTVGIPARKVVTIPNGVDLRRFDGAGQREGRRALEVGPGIVVVGTVGRLDPVKDQRTLLEAFAQLGAAGDDARLVLVGDGPCRADLESSVRRLGLDRRVRLLGDRRDVSTLLPGFDIFVLPSIAEGISNTILEAMASAVPVVATSTGGNGELVEDGVTGALVPVGDPARLAEVLARYAGDAHLREVSGKAGRQRAEQRFSLARMTGDYAALYEHLVNGAEGGR